jgi:hypothetical protein
MKWGENIFLRQVQIAQFKKFNFNEANLGAAWKLAIKDLLNPLFIVSFFLSLVFLFFAEASWTKIIWMTLRPVAVGFVIFLIVRLCPLDKIAIYFEKKGFKSFSKLLAQALKIFKEKSGE